MDKYEELEEINKDIEEDLLRFKQSGKQSIEKKQFFIFKISRDFYDCKLYVI